MAINVGRAGQVSAIACAGVLLAAACVGAPPGPSSDRPPPAAASTATPVSAAVLEVVAPPPTPAPPAPSAPAPLLAPSIARPAVAAPDAGAPSALPSLGSPLASWMRVARATPMRAAPSDEGTRFTDAPEGAALKVLESRPGWSLVAFGGDGDTRAPGTAWVRASDLSPLTEVPSWLRNDVPVALRTDAGAEVSLPAWSWLALAGGARGQSLSVRYPGDGRQQPPLQGWVAAAALVPARTLTPAEVPRGFPETATLAAPDVRLKVPYRSQLDGTPWASANCGPTTIGMALDAFGLGAPSKVLRDAVLDAQGLWGDDVGSYIEALDQVTRARGLRTYGLYEDGRRKRWSVEDVRSQLRAGRPVIAQVAFRALPGRSQSLYLGDHYIILTGLLGERFLYNDSIDSDGIGYDRVVTPDELTRAMQATDTRYAFAAFAVGR